MHKLYLKSFLAAFLFNLTLAHASSVEDINKIIREKKITCIEALLPELPTEYREHFVMVHQGPGRQAKSLTDPRILMFGRTAQTVIGFNGNPNHTGYPNLEVREFDPKTNQFQYSQFTFFESNEPRLDKNVRECSRCHGNIPLPVYDHYYTSWPGFFQDFGRDTLRVPTFADEQTAYNNFRKMALSEHPRYRHLIPTYMADPDQSGFDKRNHASFQPLNMLAKLESRWVGRHMAAEMKKDPLFERLKYSLIYYHTIFSHRNHGSSVPRCSDSESHVKIWNFLRSMIRTKYQGQAWLEQLDDELNKRKSSDILFPLLFSYHQALSIFTDKNPMPRVDVEYQDGVDAPFTHAVMTLLHEEIAKNSEIGSISIAVPGRMQAYFGNRYSGTPSEYLDEVVTWVGPKDASYDEFCSKLKALSLAELSKFGVSQ